MRSLKCVFLCGSIVKFSILSVSLLLFAFCFSNPTHAATYSASLSTSSSLTINASGVGNGTSVGVDNLTVTSTCPSGYNITIEGPSDTNLYLNGNSSNNASGTYIAHSTGTPSNPAVITGANKGTWGYSTTSSTGTGTFIGLTNTATTLVSKNSASASGGDAIPVYYGVSLPDGIAPGTYQMPGTSAITYYLTRSDNCVSYLVSFNANGGSGTAMSNQRIYEDQATALSANTYTAPTGKIFKEWNTAADGTGTSYSDGQSVTNIASAGSTLPLYAIWIIPLYMQDMNFSQCTTTPMTVYDKRDMQAYTVAKLADGNCWMTKNLNIAGGTALSADDTDVDASYISSFTTSNNLTKSGSTIVLPSSSTSGFSTNNYSYVYNSASTDCSSSTGCYGYYSWDAATLGSGRSISANNTDAPYSICPKGWTLPTSRTTSATDWQTASDYYILAHQYGLDSTTSTSENDAGFYTQAGPGTTSNFLLGGHYTNNDVPFGKGGVEGNYWSATSSSSSFARNLNFNSTEVDSSANFDRNNGFSVRCMKEDPALYKKVERQSKGTQTAANLQSTISASNSGVYQYDSTVFGTDTDGTKSDNTKANIYYYRGILDSTTGTYGSNGDGAAYPNYVILQTGSSKATTDTCWRIIRTTGSGGVKLIYNGLWTGSTCANGTTSAQISSPVSTSTFNGTASTATIARQVVRVGYTHNSTYASTSTTTSTAFATVMGSDSDYSVNNTNSTIKGNVETWYNNTIADFGGMLEPNAGFCNDRYSFTTSTGTTATSNIRPYTTSTNTGATYVAYFAGYQRNATSARTPSLGCYSGRNTVDIYSTDTSKGGNGQLSAPVGLLTADEASFAGSGSSTATNGSTYNAKSYLNTGSNFWTMTPSYRSSGYAYNLYISTGGVLTNNGRIDTAYGIRPVISLVEGTIATSGTGIATDPWVIKPVEDLYRMVANMSKGTQSVSDLQAVITTPTSSDPSIDTSNSGVFEYDSSVFGASSDASNSRKIYYYRGILDSDRNPSSNYNSEIAGSNGDGAYYPNYVKLGDTCWRIFRTTGSGGVKMIYNGLYSEGTTANSCANVSSDSFIRTISFSKKGNSSDTYWYRNINRVGYTFNNTASLQDSTTSTSVDTVFGSNSNYSTTNTENSGIKSIIENSWFDGAIGDYSSILEPSAGFCNDRTPFSDEAGSTPLSSIQPYASSNASMYFGAYARNSYAGGKLTLSCSSSRNAVDLYTTNQANDGNKQLSKPVALLTADEAALSGSGRTCKTDGPSTYSSNCSKSSFLSAAGGAHSWLMSPMSRYSAGDAREFFLSGGGGMGYDDVRTSYGIRPVISLKTGVVPSSGSGTAIDPWVIDEP